MKITTLTTPDGRFTMLVEDGAVVAAGWTDSAEVVIDRVPAAHRPRQVTAVAADDPEVSDITEAVRRYYAGDLTAIDTVRVRQWGTPLQLLGWQQLRAIPPGAPLSYTGFAAALGRPSAVRAAAAICARNAPALFVPCHRVLRGDGSLGGFAWGLDVKRSLLEREARSRS